MVSANLRLVAMVVARVAGEGLGYTDNLQNGVFGLIRAAEKFDPERGYKFSTYAYLWIRQAVGTGLLAERPIRLPAPVDAAVRGLRNGRCSDHCREAGELAATGWKSLDCIIPGGEETCTLAELLPAPSGPTVDASAALESLQLALEAMRSAEPDSVAMLELFHGEDWPITQVASLAGVGHNKARKSMAAAVTNLRELSEVRLALAELAC
jgi:hypothetical protein